MCAALVVVAVAVALRTLRTAAVYLMVHRLHLPPFPYPAREEQAVAVAAQHRLSAQALPLAPRLLQPHFSLMLR